MVQPNENPREANRRQVLKSLTGLGVGTLVFQRALAAQVDPSTQITAEMVKQAEWIAGIKLSDEDRESTADALNGTQRKFQQLRTVDVGYDVAPALSFHAAPATPTVDRDQKHPQVSPGQSSVARPADDSSLAFMSVSDLSGLLRTRQISSVELTNLYLDRLHRYDELLHCVVTFTDDLALRQAEQADREIASGAYRGPLHGIPWGAKDLIACPGYPTTWGATPFKTQTLDEKATVTTRLENAGAVLAAKLSLGALAWGDLWFGGMTRNPWNPQEGSSGSSAGSASATAAGLVGFTLGSETLGSIVSPCRRCGTTGLRPTFGRVSRHGCMPLAWSMDKIGPITRSVEDCALVFAAIQGSDGLDGTVVDRPFHWPLRRSLKTLTVGYSAGEGEPDERDDLRVLKDLGVRLKPITLPDPRLSAPLTLILNVEASTVFDDLVRRGVTDGLNRWPPVLRKAQFIPAVEYLRANRVRMLLMREMERVMSDVDLYVGGDDLTLTNFTGHPSVVLPAGFEQRGGVEVPHSVKFTGRLFGETELLAVAHAWQRATGVHLRRPNLDQKPQEKP